MRGEFMAGEVRYRQSLFQKFKENFEDKVDQQRNEVVQSTVPNALVAHRRRGLDEAELMKSISENIGHIVNTIDLQSSLDLSPYPFVRKSILNFGLYDFHGLGSEGNKAALVEQNVAAAVMFYEPRIVKDTVHMERNELSDDISQRLEMILTGDVKSDPVDLEIELKAEMDLSSGKIHISRGS